MLRSAPAAGARGRVAIIDIGSNSIRLVVYDAIGRAPQALTNEKVLCGLGRGLSTTGRLNAEAVDVAVLNLRRFVALARAIGVGRLEVIATAAVRDAADGVQFVREVEKSCGVRVQVVAGEAEGRLSALGVVAGIPEADGIMGDLGGGSVELVALDKGRPGAAVTLPVGPLRLMHVADSEKKLRETVDDALAEAPHLRHGRGRELYLVGGAWRALARIHMEHSAYPLHIIHNYVVSRGDAEGFLGLVGHLSKKSLEKITGISKKRLEAVPIAAFVLARLVRQVEPKRLVFSAFGLREGRLFDLLPEADRAADPLLTACDSLAEQRRRFGMPASELVLWTAPLFADEPAKYRRLRQAASLLSDIGWTAHPDYRAEETFLHVLRLPFGGLDHGERVWLATALHARYGGPAEARILEPTRRLLSSEAAANARIVGLALRLAYTLCGGAPKLLPRTSLAVDGGAVELTVPAGDLVFGGETVQRRLDALAKALGRKPTLIERSPSPARGAARG
jgi:exopolyphosphatase / guanosine-5'-triphosphate,3'-diphosphate pyrophosphatase